MGKYRFLKKISLETLTVNAKNLLKLWSNLCGEIKKGFKAFKLARNAIHVIVQYFSSKIKAPDFSKIIVFEYFKENVM